MKTFCFTVDDNIRFFKEITENGYKSIFEHPYLAMYKRLHERFNLKVQLNLFYKTDEFILSRFSDKYYNEWQENSDWLKLSFHSDYEKICPYEFSGYDEVYEDCKRVNDEILRFASPSALAKTTTIHYCLATEDGLKALSDNNVTGLLGLFGSSSSYGIGEEDAEKLRKGEIIKLGKISYAAIDIVLNNFSKEDILAKIKKLTNRNNINVMIHEQYFYPDYGRYQPDFEEKIASAFSLLTQNVYKSCFLEELL